MTHVLKTLSMLALGVLLLGGAANFSSAHAASRAEIDASVDGTLARFFSDYPYARGLANRARAILIFPNVIKAGFGVGGEYGEGALHVGGRPSAYYNLVSASFGFQLGAQSRSIIIMFMTDSAFNKFRRSKGWEVGVDGSVTLINVGAAGTVDTTNLKSDTIGFVFGAKGLMYNLSLEGSKISRIDR